MSQDYTTLPRIFLPEEPEETLIPENPPAFDKRLVERVLNFLKSDAFSTVGLSPLGTYSREPKAPLPKGSVRHPGWTSIIEAKVDLEKALLSYVKKEKDASAEVLLAEFFRCKSMLRRR